eukprot:2393602-Lingulodinium_polyedra.AAC.1
MSKHAHKTCSRASRAGPGGAHGAASEAGDGDDAERQTGASATRACAETTSKTRSWRQCSPL